MEMGVTTTKEGVAYFPLFTKEELKSLTKAAEEVVINGGDDLQMCVASMLLDWKERRGREE